MQKISNSELREMSNVVPTKKLNRRPFLFHYLELCRAKNIAPLADIRSKNNDTSVLQFFGDKLTVNDWLLIIRALYFDQALQTLGIRMRKTFGMVLEHLDTEKKAKLFRQKSVIYTKFIFSGVVEAISNCIKFNKNLRVLNLEGLPLNDKYVESIAKALASNESINEISFQRSNIQDKGCEAICNTIKYLEHVEKLNLSACELTTKGAEFVADMIKVQKINRYTEGWQKSLRYRDVDPETIPGLRFISLSRNQQIGDDGVKSIVEVLKEDIWIKVIDMENCGLTDRAANMILDCLDINNYILDFNVRNNEGMNKFLQRSIRDKLGKEDEELLGGKEELVQGPNGIVIKRKKVTVAVLKEQLKTLEEQLSFERVLRKKAEQLNEKLNKQILAYENQLQSIIKERNDFQKIAVGIVNSTETTKSDDLIVPLNSPTQAESRKILKVRKVKSEMKYVDPPTKDSKKESKSDHEFLNDNDCQMTAVHFETNIGDTITHQNNTSSGNSLVTITNSQLVNGKEKNLNSKSNISRNKNRKNPFENLTKFELDDLSIPTTRSISSDIYSSDSDTLRNNIEYQPLKVFIRHSKPFPLTPMPKPSELESTGNIGNNITQNGGPSHVEKSPRSLFLGLCND